MDKIANPSPGMKSHPGHRITVTPHAGTVTVRFADAVIAESDKALVLQEANYPPVLYVPFADIDFGILQPTDTSTHCPFKGDASYWSAATSGQSRKDVMWAYQQPYDEMQAIKDHGAFYPDRVSIEVRPM